MTFLAVLDNNAVCCINNKLFVVCFLVGIILTLQKILHILMIYPQPVRRHYHPKYTLITLAPVSYLRSLVVRAVHRHRTGVGSIPAGGPIVDEFFSTVPG